VRNSSGIQTINVWRKGLVHKALGEKSGGTNKRKSIGLIGRNMIPIKDLEREPPEDRITWIAEASMQRANLLAWRHPSKAKPNGADLTHLPLAAHSKSILPKILGHNEFRTQRPESKRTIAISP
jgi:hypothetical protein